MKSALAFCVFLSSVVCAVGQTTVKTSNAPPAADSGVASEWDARKLIDALSQQASHLKPIIDQVQPAAWQAKGASPTYVAQWNTTQTQLKYLIAAADGFARQPERLTLGLDMYFRMQAMESTLGSLIEGVRKYQNPALASIMQSVVAENSTNRDRLRQYLQDLAAQKEEEFEVADREAQRCRTALLQQPAPKVRAKKVSRP
jgi:ABC-type transporter Mla subunit MlaD